MPLSYHLNHISTKLLEEIYSKYNRREFVHPDPLEFLYHYDNCDDIEIVGLIASSLAYGNVKQILKSVENVLEPMGKRPSLWLKNRNEDEIKNSFSGFKHRFTTAEEFIQFLLGIKKVLEMDGPLKEFIRESNTSSVVDIEEKLVEKIRGVFSLEKISLLPDVKKRSACKRLNLFFRWMVRKDEVDPGCWSDILSPEILIVPLDTHMYKFALKAGFTERKSTDMKTAMEITKKFRKINPDDPVKYDFVITRAGIGDWFQWE